MKKATRVIWAMAMVGCAALLCANTSSAGSSKKEREMQAQMDEAEKWKGEWDMAQAFQIYSKLAKDPSCPSVQKDAQKELESMKKDVNDILAKADDLIKSKEPDETELTETLAKLAKMKVRWLRYATYSSQADKRVKKLLAKYKKLNRDGARMAEKEAKALVKEAKSFLRGKNVDLRSALASYEMLFADYAYTRTAKKSISIFFKLRQMVREKNKQEAEEAKRNKK